VELTSRKKSINGLKFLVCVISTDNRYERGGGKGVRVQFKVNQR
jgi:hypothetical protein